MKSYDPVTNQVYLPQCWIVAVSTK